MAWFALAASAMQAVQQKQQGDQAGAVNDYNATVAEQEGAAAENSANYKAKQYERKVGSLISEQRASAAASGLGLEGSPVEVMDETARQGAYDALLIRYDGSLAASRARSQATLDRLGGDVARADGNDAAKASLLTGLTNLAAKFKQKPTGGGGGAYASGGGGRVGGMSLPE